MTGLKIDENRVKDLTSILALILRDRLSELSKFSSKTVQLNTKLEGLYQTIPDHPTFAKQEIAGLLQQITIAQTLIQATTILGKTIMLLIHLTTSLSNINERIFNRPLYRV